MQPDAQTQIASDVTLTATALVPSDASPVVYDQSTPGRHIELGNEIGLIVCIKAIDLTGTTTYQFQILSDSTADLGTAPIVVGDTGTLANTDKRLTGKVFFLPIMPGAVTKQYLGVKFTGANSPSIEFDAYFIPQAEAPAWIAQPNNYTA